MPVISISNPEELDHYLNRNKKLTEKFGDENEKIFVRLIVSKNFCSFTLKEFKDETYIIINEKILGDTTFISCTFLKKVRLSTNFPDINLKIESCSFNKGLVINDIKKINIKNSLLYGRIYIYGELTQEVLFNVCNYYNDEDNNYGINGETQKIENSKVIFNLKNIQKIQLDSFNTGDLYFLISGNENKRIILNDISVKKILKIGIREFKIEEIHIKRLETNDNNLTIEFRDFIVTNFIFSYSYLIPKIIFSNIEFNNIYLKEVDLNNSMFNSCIIKNLYMNGVNIDGSIINDLSFYNNYHLEKLWFYEKQGDGLNDGILKDNYRQLKNVMDNNGNHTEANKFYALEMKYHGKTLEKISDKFLFWLGKNISNFGNNWVLALFWIFILASIPMFFEGVINLYYGAITWQDIINGMLLESFLNGFLGNVTVFSKIYDKTEELSAQLVVYNLMMIYLIYCFIVSIKRTTKR